MKFLNKYRYIFIFFICLAANFIFVDRFYDGPYQYGMAHAIIMGELPYLDFSMVTTPLFPFIHAVFLSIYDSFLTYIVVNSIIITLLFYYAEKLLPSNFITYFLILLLPLCDFFCPTYNLLAKFFIMLILYMEKNNKSDYLIGFFLGLLVLTKHSVGLFVLLMSFLYRKDLKGCFKRLIGFLIPIVLFLIYLIISKTMYLFIDLTFLGLFDFGRKNTKSSPFLIVLYILMFSFLLYDIIKGKKESKYLSYYALGSLSFMIPIFDLHHFSATFLFVLLVLFNKKIIKMNYILFNSFLICLEIVFVFLYLIITYQSIYFKSFNHFPYYLGASKDAESVLKVYGNTYPNSIMLDVKGIFYDIVLDNKITYFDIPHTGNYGRMGTQNMISKLKKDTHYFISKDYKIINIDQFDTELCDYIIKHSTLVDSVSIYNIYYYGG